MGITLVFSLLGGLGLFLLGMQMMSEGLEKAAGARMRRLLELFTKNRFIGMLIGIAVTAIIQSSSATTVMVVGFVNSGLMSLLQSTGVILGANIGTTVTGLLIAFDLSEIAPLFVMAGVIMELFLKKQSVKQIGEVVLGFGILFMGLNIMGDSMSTLKESPQVVELLKSLVSPYAAIVVGCIITAIIQSSSVTVGIVILMAAQGLITISICPFIILGCNIGSCVSALLASLGGKRNAKRAALIHFLFNVIGSAVTFSIFLIMGSLLTDIFIQVSGGNIARAVANIHTSMKIFEVMLLFPFMGWIVKITYKIVPGKDGSSEEAYDLLYIGKGSILLPVTAVSNGMHEIEHMGKVTIENLQEAVNILCLDRQEEIEKLYKREKYIEFMNQSITDYLVRISEMDLPAADVKLLGSLFHVVSDIERISDHTGEIANTAKERIEGKIELDDKSKQQLQDMTEKVVKILKYAIEVFHNAKQEYIPEILELKEMIEQKKKKLHRSHVKRLINNQCNSKTGMAFSDTVFCLERVADHAINITFAASAPIDELDAEE